MSETRETRCHRASPPAPPHRRRLLGAVLLAVWAAAAGLVRHALLTESWQRLTTVTFDRSAPAWYFLPVLAGVMFPWSLAVAAAWAVPASRGCAPGA